jgi:hypothetical protein
LAVGSPPDEVAVAESIESEVARSVLLFVKGRPFVAGLFFDRNLSADEVINVVSISGEGDGRFLVITTYPLGIGGNRQVIELVVSKVDNEWRASLREARMLHGREGSGLFW